MDEKNGTPRACGAFRFERLTTSFHRQDVLPVGMRVMQLVHHLLGQAEMILVRQIEVVEIAACLPGGVHHGADVDLRPIREGRKDVGKQSGSAKSKRIAKKQKNHPVKPDPDTEGRANESET